MKLFRSALDDWEKNITEEDLRKMEAQGCDVSAYREKLAARRQQEAAQEAHDLAKYHNPTDLTKLDPYKTTPRSTDSEFFKAVAGKAPWFGKKTWLKSNTEGKIVYAGVVDIPAAARKPQKSHDTHQAVVIYAVDDKHAYDTEWLKGLTAILREMRDGKRPTPAGVAPLMDLIADESNWQEGNLPASVTGDAEVRYGKVIIDTNKLPNGYLPTDGIVPHLVWEAIIKQIPAQFYSK